MALSGDEDWQEWSCELRISTFAKLMTKKEHWESKTKTQTHTKNETQNPPRLL